MQFSFESQEPSKRFINKGHLQKKKEMNPLLLALLEAEITVQNPGKEWVFHV